MRRRTVLIGLGGIAGTSALVGSGAFTSVSANRSVSVSVADDSNALLALEPSNGPNGEYATGGDTLSLDLSTSDGTGVGTDSTYNFDDVFRVTNQGTQQVYVWATFDFSNVEFGPGDIYFYPNGDEGEKLRDSTDEVLGLGVGQSAAIGVYVDSEAVTDGGTLPVTIHADVDKPDPSSAVDGDGEDFVVVTQNPTESNEYATIQGAIDNVTGSTIYIRNGTYDLGTDRLNIREQDLDSSVGGLTIVGESEAGVVIDASARDSWGAYITADNVSLRRFTLRGPENTASGYPSGYYGLKVDDLKNFSMQNVTVEGSAVTQVDLNSVQGASLQDVTVDGLSSSYGTGLFFTNCQDVVVDGITARNNPWGGIGISAQQNSGYAVPDPTARNISLTGSNTIEDSPILYTEEQPSSDYHTGSARGSAVDTDGDGDWDVSFPLDGGADPAHDVTDATVDTGTDTGSLSHTLVYERSKNGTPDQVAELYYLDVNSRDAAKSDFENATGTYTYDVLTTDSLT